ncbi:ArdC family protein [Cyanobium gracile]|uniref:Antirestriction protein n=1 Tax=Cyanobium gracile (strain ATCC 27147 / PCC 6307) TaxID=292564 RepID=K9P6V5_CYAGP|nr:zincin-like metallopeptidase domain-containing protein [Cyanobium gracile]AFY28451.1 antirestriction protein [Cyanobium gracile PCC 6307]
MTSTSAPKDCQAIDQSSAPGTGHEERLTHSLIELMANGVNPWRKPWNPNRGGSHRNLVTGHHYTGGNPVLLEMQMAARGSELPLWLGYNQAKEQGWSPHKGSKACIIIRPQFNQYEELDADGNPQRDANGEPVITTWVSYKPAAVFNAADLHGDGIEKAITKALGDVKPVPESQRLAEARAVLQAWPVPVIYGTDCACYIPALDRIQLPTAGSFHSHEAFLATHAHEAIHSTGAAKRLNRDGVARRHSFGSEAYAKEELIAELGAFLLTQRLGIGSNSENHAAYLHHWIQILQESPRILFRLLSDATKAADLIASSVSQTAAVKGPKPSPILVRS